MEKRKKQKIGKEKFVKSNYVSEEAKLNDAKNTLFPDQMQNTL